MSEEKDPARGGDKAFDASNAGKPGPGRVVSAEEEEGVPATDTTAATPLGVGESQGRRAEEVAAHEESSGRQTTGTQGPSERPVGTSSAEDSTGVDPKGTVTEGSTEVGTGDQGG